MTALTAQIEGIGILGPGFDDWPGAVALLTGAAIAVVQPTVVPALDLLPPAERRRAALIVRLALSTGMQAARMAARDPAVLASVFASSGGDGPNCHEICTVLASADRQLSPTRFHNAVHNAAAGYWSIATGAKTPSNALSAHDSSFAAGLLEALVQLATNQRPVLLIAYDAPYPQPLHAERPIADAFAVALVLAPVVQGFAHAHLSVTLGEEPAGRLADVRLEALRRSIPAARSLPLLRLLARREQGRVVLDYLDGQSVAVVVTP
ncbi:MAG: beta-ketoacyl synthase chain length factor [Pseudomonadota bacterium]